MLYSLPQIRSTSRPARLAAIAVFVALTALAARVTIPMLPVPFTLQTLAVLLSSLVLGWRDGALSQLAYVGLIAIGLPIDANAIGAAALAGPTAGFLFGFAPAAAVTGLMATIGGRSLWMRWLAGVYGVFVLYVCGIAWLTVALALSPNVAFNAVDQFIALDALKALVAAGLAETGRLYLSQSPDA